MAIGSASVRSTSAWMQAAKTDPETPSARAVEGFLTLARLRDTVDLDRPGPVRIQTGNGAQHRGFARTGFADDAVALARRNRDLRIAHRMQRTEADIQVLNFNRGPSHASTPDHD